MVLATLLRGLNRLLDAASDARRRKAEREVAAFVLRQGGGRLGDQAERRIERLLSTRR